LAVGKLIFNHLWKHQSHHNEPTTNSL
jgi:hypothetical protein